MGPFTPSTQSALGPDGTLVVGRNHEYAFHRSAWLRPDLGNTHVLTVTPGPRLKRSDSSFPSEPDVVTER